MLAAQAEAARIIMPTGSAQNQNEQSQAASAASRQSMQKQQQDAAASMLMQREEIMSQIVDPNMLNHLYEVRKIVARSESVW